MHLYAMVNTPPKPEKMKDFIARFLGKRPQPACYEPKRK